jgi:catechol 2,3-dioxygenase-like lactoylglutathione lyase family enzyme
MAFHHVAVAVKDAQATHRFYTEAMGFKLVKVVAGKTQEGGWAKHLFYDTGNGELMAFWDLHDESIGTQWSPALATGQGLPIWTNHLAWNADSLETLEAAKRRWLAHGHDVSEVDHGWCTSIYTADPNGILVEFCITTRELDATDAAEAARLLADPKPPLESLPSARFFRARDFRQPA